MWVKCSGVTIGTDSPPNPLRPLALYVHIPFCRSRCTYCAFNTYAGMDALIPAYVEALSVEIRAAPGAPARTLYFGGGTPSLLSQDALASILQALQERFRFSPQMEITLEANPGTVDQMYLRAVRELGVNRLSLGVQSAHADELHLLGRQHTWEDAMKAVADARAAGLENVNLDLIYGLPGQTLARWKETLEAALSLDPDHLSLYALTVEEGTPLEEQVVRGALPPPDDDRTAEMYEWAETRLAQAGYIHYELSNWARSDRYFCQHNRIYWRNEPYLGLGAGASSWWGGRRWTNVRHPREYIRRLKTGQPIGEEMEVISRQLEMGETMLMGLRLMEGVSDARFRARFGVGLGEAFGAELTRLAAQGLLEWDGKTARLTPRGRLLGNWVFREFV
ncbi:MAG: radical SAM family heme chaperone HemW [Anaerolineae bacterium]|nr:radical SAM family heme chaperone HemW [Anaerolineae bacterium]MDW8069345.1 radical SAM family heme chaperone HemW [Anaerolineae bacterium]